jgi:hypothetical protein
MFDVFYIGTKPNLFAHEQQVDSVEQAQEQSRTRFFWMVSYLVDYTGFDFLYEPLPWQAHQRHAWPSQWQQDSDTYLVPSTGYTDTNYHNAPVLPRTLATAVYEIDHLDGAAGHIPGVARRVRYFDNYRDTLIRLARSIGTEHEFVWVCSSICDYTNFDFSWHPSHWQYTLLHVFASDEQKFGDTFFMHVPSFAARAETVELLDWYDCNFVDSYLSVPRRPMPVITHDDDTHVDAVLARDFAGPLAIFSTGHSTSQGLSPPAVSLWREKTKTIVPLSPSASSVIVPKIAIPYIKTQLYDYPNIDKTHSNDRTDAVMDVVFISYDEPDAEQNWNMLAQRCARAKRVHGVAGMETALEAAADLSSTPWYYAVFAKTRLHEQFDFSHMPDFMQQPKNYIFDCINTVNGLQYGHMGIVMYNCEGIRQLNQAKNFGLDYTLSFAHESVPIVSCYGNFNQTPYHTWRTAFRECAKLSYFESQLPTVDGEYRLNTWLSRAQGNHAEWCLKGAQDGVEFFKASDQELSTLKQSFRWQWLREYFVSRYGDLQ